jgi:hypothetical protein
MKRRDFLGMTAAGVTGLAAWQSGSVEAAGVARATLAHPDLLGVLRDERLVADLGRRYREVVPAERTAPALEAAILADAPASSSVAPRAWLADLVQRDFEAGRLVTLDGWVLSVTEARQSALFSLWIA